MSELRDRFLRHADAMARAGRSPLYEALIRGAAEDDVVAELFADDRLPEQSVPALRLLAPLHELVLSGRAPNLAVFYPSAGGSLPAAGAWPAARAAIAEHFDWIRPRLPRTIQTNEPGRSAALYAGLQWVGRRDPRPVRLLDIGASAGLNLIPDRYAYSSDGRTYGDPASPVRFEQPWSRALGPAPEIVARRGCDVEPRDASDPAQRLTLLSYVWPDELERFERADAALRLLAADPPPVDRAPAAQWLAAQLADTDDDVHTVVWHSVMRQYVPRDEWAAVLELTAATTVLSLEPAEDHMADFALRHHDDKLADCGPHGPPVAWC